MLGGVDGRGEGVAAVRPDLVGRGTGAIVDLEVVVVTVRVVLHAERGEGHGDNLAGGGDDSPGTADTVGVGGARLCGVAQRTCLLGQHTTTRCNRNIHKS